VADYEEYLSDRVAGSCSYFRISSKKRSARGPTGRAREGLLRITACWSAPALDQERYAPVPGKLAERGYRLLLDPAGSSSIARAIARRFRLRPPEPEKPGLPGSKRRARATDQDVERSRIGVHASAVSAWSALPLASLARPRRTRRGSARSADVAQEEVFPSASGQEPPENPRGAHLAPRSSMTASVVSRRTTLARLGPVDGHASSAADSSCAKNQHS
jgi:hypothetical protein